MQRVVRFYPQNFNFSDKAVDAIKELEAFRDHLYLDGNKNYIFGYGHLVAPNPQLVREGFEHLKEVKDEIQMFKTKYGTGAGDGTATQQEKMKLSTCISQRPWNHHFQYEKFITVPLTQNKIDAIVIYLF